LLTTLPHRWPGLAIRASHAIAAWYPPLVHILEAFFQIGIRPPKPSEPPESLQPCGFLMHAVCRPLPPEPSAKSEIVRREAVDPDAVWLGARDTSGSSGEYFN
jgi:hypothetical protein